RRLRSSVLGVTALSDTISLVPSAKLPPASFIAAAAVLRLRFSSSAVIRMLFRRAFRGRRAMRSRQETPKFLRHPDWPNQQIDRSLKKCWSIAFDAVPHKQKDPASQENSKSQEPLRENHQDGACEDHGDSDAVAHFVPGRGMLVIVLRHVVRQSR